ncbi:hypothetical protein RHGRI_036890 [Rhododendron griersonianum]|uniref:Non-specific lipid-transfer protein n=1 Tax=Rhododendron griersonianum TaxID=479676 RepID=A0AAV6HQA5_9ERIC|nr:hypothetical protein RHGRI_036890 [Rhododendron griersonianum]
MKSLFLSMTLLLSLLFFVARIEAAILCNTVTQKAAPCLTYATGKDKNPSAGCCTGLQQLVKSVGSVADKKQICRCLQASAKNMGIQDRFLSQLPNVCKINVGFRVSTSTNCEKIN